MTKKFLTFVIVLLGTLTSYSQVSTNDTLKVVKLNDVEVIGIRPSTNTPISQKTMTSLDISKDFHGQEMIYVLEKTPSVTTQSDGGQPQGYTYFRIRGIDQTRINVTLNGSPFNEPEDQGAYYSNYPGFALNIKSLQIQRGVGTSSNGTSSYGGSINYESKDGLEKGFNGNLTVGSLNTQMYNINYGSGLLKNKLALYGSLSTYTSDGYRYHSGGYGSSAFIAGGYYGDKDIIKLTSFLGSSTNRMAWLPTPESQINIDRKTNVLSDLDKDGFNQDFIQLQEIHNFSSDFIVTNTLFYNNLIGMYNMHFDIYPTYIANYKSNFYGYSTNFKFNINKFKINTGLSINLYDRQHFGNGIVDYDGTYDNVGHKNEYSAYIKPEYSIGKFNIYGDLQLRNVNFTYHDNKNLGKDYTKQWSPFLNPRVGASYKLTDIEKVYVYIGQSQREPTRTDMFGGTEYNLGITDLTPETVNDYELGYKLNTNNLNINVNLYYMNFYNQFIPTGKISTLNSMMIMTSVDRSFRSGIEFDGKYQILDNFSTSNNTTLSYNKILSNGLDYMLYTPNVIVNQDVEYIYKNFYINISVRYLSKSYIDLNDNSAFCPDYTILNAKIGYIDKHIDLSVSGMNLSNANYYTSGNISYGEKCYFVGTPISFYTTLKINF